MPIYSIIGGIGDLGGAILKREERLQDVPASISAVTGGALAQRGIANVRDLSKAVPNLVWGEFAGTALVTIRGVGSNIDSGITEPTVAMYVDGLALPRSTMAMMRTVDLERVEVLRGPQGTLYGRNATGGAINLISARPTREFAAKVEGSTGSRDAWGVNGFVSGPVADGVFVRASGGREKQDGYVKVLNTGQRLAGVDAIYGRLALLLEPTSDVSVDLALRYEKNKAAVGFQQQLSPSTLLPPGTYTTEPNRFLADGPFSGLKETFVASGGITWNVSDTLTVKSLTGYIDHRSQDAYECDVSLLHIYNYPNFNRSSKSFS
jgi:iron complex outermembrane recepter protein